jgi:redox-sensitive bicupin YhaK (pirin superfamily)
MSSTIATRPAKRLVRSFPVHAMEEGAGFLVHRPFPVPGLSYIDPFLLLDEMGPKVYGPGEAKGAPDHPHRGFETVTYMLEGEFEHADSAGNRGDLKPGDVQWMTAGAGVVHSEMPSQKIMQRGGKVHGFQLWVNLPASAKMSPPRYQELKSAAIPEVSLPEEAGRVRVIAGEVNGVRAKVNTQVPITYLDLKLEPDASTRLTLQAPLRTLIYPISGSASIGTEELERGNLYQLSDEEAELVLDSAEEGFRALILQGQPLNEPVARYGPFVMNTREEVMQAVVDYQNGKMGSLRPEVKRIDIEE